MINQLELRGFKSYYDASLHLRPLTILTGLNSSGKSTCIQVLRILGRVASEEKNPLLPGYGSARELRNPNVEKWILNAFSENAEKISYSEDNIKENNFNIFPRVIYISAGRLGPQVSLHLHADEELDELGENVLQCIEQNQDLIIPEVLRHPNAEGDTLLYNLRAWLGTISPNVKFDWKIQEYTDSSYSLFDNHRANNVGFGLSYSLSIIVAILLASTEDNKGKTLVLLENPEAHLHPRGQVEMASLIAKAVEAGVQVIVETHSDHFFDGIRIAVKESKNDLCDKVITYWFEQDEQKNTQEEACFIDNNGRVAKWPKGMFDQFEIDAYKLM